MFSVKYGEMEYLSISILKWVFVKLDNLSNSLIRIEFGVQYERSFNLIFIFYWPSHPK